MLFFFVILSLTTNVFATNVSVKGYFRKNGTYVAPHYRTSPNSSKYDNWSTKGNINPFTGKPGTKDPYSGGSTYPNETFGTAYPLPSDLGGNAPAESKSSNGQVQKIRSNKEFFSQAYADCEFMRGSNGEASCIKRRISDLKEIEWLRRDPNFKEANENCSFMRGLNGEAGCIRRRIHEIMEIEELRSSTYFPKAYKDCGFMRGSNGEASCIRRRVGEMKEIESMAAD